MAGASAAFVTPIPPPHFFRHSGFRHNITSLAALQRAKRRHLSLASMGECRHHSRKTTRLVWSNRNSTKLCYSRSRLAFIYSPIPPSNCTYFLQQKEIPWNNIAQKKKDCLSARKSDTSSSTSAPNLATWVKKKAQCNTLFHCRQTVPNGWWSKNSLR